MGVEAGSSREEQRARTRAELRRSALALFAERGFEKANVADIASAAGVTERTFFRHFPSKESVLFEDFASRLGWFRAALDVRPETEPVLDSVLVAIESFPDDREVVRQVAGMRASLLTSSAIDDQLRRVQAGFAREIERHLAGRLPTAPDADLDAAALGAAIAGALVSSLRIWGERGGSDTDELRGLAARALALLRDPPPAVRG